eukprot:8014568-Prorocentrum_lima.AAC.1
MAMSQELNCASLHCSNMWRLTMSNATKTVEILRTFFKTDNGQGCLPNCFSFGIAAIREACQEAED